MEEKNLGGGDRNVLKLDCYQYNSMNLPKIAKNLLIVYAKGKKVELEHEPI